MKINAIRLKEVGRFSAPVALERLSGGLDVLVGANEFGKSTIINAVRTVLFEQYRSRHRRLEALRPYSGGAPTVEVDFHVQGHTWRIRKQFLSAPAAELRNLQSNAVMRGADAEARLAELVGDNGPFGMLYVEQGSSLLPVAPKAGGGATLIAAVEGEVANIADGEAARFVAEQVREQLAMLVTARHGRPTGVYKAALDEMKRLEDDRSRARERLALAQKRLDELERVRNRLAELAAVTSVEQRTQAEAAAKRTLDEAREARRKSDAAVSAIAAAKQRCAAASQLLDALDRQIAELARLQSGLSEATAHLGDLKARAAAAAAFAADRRKVHAALKAELARLEKARRASELAGRLRQREGQLAGAREAAAVCATAAAELEANTADEAVVSAARREAARIAELQARLMAAAPTVSLAYFDGAAGKITVDGRALDDGEVLHPTQPLTLTIAGIGTLTIASGRSSDVAADEAMLADHRHRLAACVARAGASDVAAAERLLAARREVVSRLNAATAEIKVAAPQGIDALQGACEQLKAQLAALGPCDDVDSDDLERRGCELADQLEGAELALAEALGAERTASEAVIAIETRIEGSAGLAAKLAGDLGEPAVRERAAEARRAELNAAKAALEAAVVEGDVWRTLAPTIERLQELEQAAVTTARVVSDAAREIGELREAKERLEGALESDRDADVATALADLEDQYASAAARCDDMTVEAAALQLLAGELDAAETRSRDRFVAPVLQRLTPYLQQVMPQARVTLDAELAPDGLERAGTREDFARLSGGTREQLGLLVRLALARLLADAGTPAPFILDDALVYADDERIDRMFAALRDASQLHQVLVLTCREQTFAALGGNRIALTAWEGARAAA